jgi:CDP-diacylglycerol--glycerol-3-phosphate 3-phosphatidyltransferase
MWAGGFLLLAGAFDLLDGAIARASGKTNPFGGILDSSLDRYGDGFVLGGILFFCAANERYGYALLALSALLGSFLVSYVRARAECVIPKCKVGFWERGERVLCVALGLLANNLAMALWMLGIGTHLTALFRLYYSAAPESASRFTPLWFHAGTRGQWPYYLKAGVLILLVVFLRLSF